MAVVNEGSVYSANADGDVIPGKRLRVCGVKAVGGAGGMTVKLKAGGVTGGDVVYECTVGNSSEKFEPVEMMIPDGAYVNISAGSGTVYIYGEAD